MNSSMIFEGISGISDAHVAEFADIDKKNRSARRKLAVRLAPVAACLCAALGIALILKLSGVFGTDDPMPNASYDYKKVSFSSFEQFASTVPDASLIDRLKKQCNYALEYNGVIDLTNKKQSQSNYDCYLVVLFDEKTVAAEISIRMRLSTQLPGPDSTAVGKPFVKILLSLPILVTIPPP